MQRPHRLLAARRMMDEQTRGALRAAQEHIQAGRRADALEILRPLCIDQRENVDAWWLLSFALDDPSKIKMALQRVLALNPDHQQARQRLAQREAPKPPESPRPKARSGSLEDVVGDLLKAPEEAATAELPQPDLRAMMEQSRKRSKSRDKKKSGREALNLARFGGLVFALLIALAVLVVLVFSTFSFNEAIKRPLMGEYYPRTMVDERYNLVCDNCLPPMPLPCPVYEFNGIVAEEEADVLVQAWTDDGFFRTATTDQNGRFYIAFAPTDLSDAVRFPGSYGEPYVHLRIFDEDDDPLSGMSNHWFNSNQCRQNVVYQRYPRDAQNANTRDAPWDGPYRITYSDLTSTDSLPQTTNHLTRLLYECDWIGVIGTAHDDKGPVPGLIVTIYEWLPGGNVNAWFIPTGDIPFMNQSGWAIELEPGKRYFIDVTNHRGQSAVSEIFYFPPVESCDQRVMLIEVSQEVR